MGIGRTLLTYVLPHLPGSSAGSSCQGQALFMLPVFVHGAREHDQRAADSSGLAPLDERVCSSLILLPAGKLGGGLPQRVLANRSS